MHTFLGYKFFSVTINFLQSAAHFSVKGPFVTSFLFPPIAVIHHGPCTLLLIKYMLVLDYQLYPAMFAGFFFTLYNLFSCTLIFRMPVYLSN